MKFGLEPNFSILLHPNLAKEAEKNPKNGLQKKCFR
jgi:hypothetical protein